MSDPINANPTVLNVSDLPSRLVELNGPVKKDPLEGDLQELLSLSLLPSGMVDDEGDLLSMTPPLLTDSESVDFSDQEEGDEFDAQEIYDLTAHISDPEHPLTLGQLLVVNLSDIKVINKPRNEISEVIIKITPTITHCSLATLIGLGIRVRLERCLPPRFRITILVKEKTHQSVN